MAHAPKPTGVICNPLEPSGRVGKLMFAPPDCKNIRNRSRVSRSQCNCDCLHVPAERVTRDNSSQCCQFLSVPAQKVAGHYESQNGFVVAPASRSRESFSVDRAFREAMGIAHVSHQIIHDKFFELCYRHAMRLPIDFRSEVIQYQLTQ
jgi:hypothetical protein